MKILILQDDMYQYLTYLVKEYANRGIDPEEGSALFNLWKSVTGAMTVTEPQVAKIKVTPEGDSATIETRLETKPEASESATPA